MARHQSTYAFWIWAGIVALTLAVGFIDYLSGYEFNFFVFYFIPVSLAAWYLGMLPSVIVSLFSVTIWYLADYYSGHRYSIYVFAIWNTIILLVSFLVIGWTIARLREQFNKEQLGRKDLERVISEVKVLEGILPICASCKKIRNDKGDWQQMEEYIRQKTNAEFTHGLCPQCGKKLLQDAGIGGDGENKQQT
jgi:K+-sensing histidine kinase KdpD